MKQNNSETWSATAKVIIGKASFAPEAVSKQEALILNDSEEHNTVSSFFWAELSKIVHCQPDCPQ